MAVTVEWDSLEHKIVLMQFSETWTWEEVDQAVHRYYEMTNGISNSVRIIVEIPPKSRVPTAFLTYARHVSGQMPIEGWSGVIVTHSLLLRSIINTLKNLKDPSAMRFQLADSITTARILLGATPLS